MLLMLDPAPGAQADTLRTLQPEPQELRDFLREIQKSLRLGTLVSDSIPRVNAKNSGVNHGFQVVRNGFRPSAVVT